MIPAAIFDQYDAPATEPTPRSVAELHTRGRGVGR